MQPVSIGASRAADSHNFPSDHSSRLSWLSNNFFTENIGLSFLALCSIFTHHRACSLWRMAVSAVMPQPRGSARVSSEANHSAEWLNYTGPTRLSIAMAS